MEKASALLIPLLVAAIVAIGLARKRPVFSLFAEGAKKGLLVCWQVLPNLLSMLVAVELSAQSGLLDALTALCRPLLQAVGLPPEIAPLALIRPLSGSGALAVLEQTMQQYGPDSRIGLIACTIMGSSETIFYTICVYQSATSCKKSGHAIACSLLGMLAGLVAAGFCFGGR